MEQVRAQWTAEQARWFWGPAAELPPHRRAMVELTQRAAPLLEGALPAEPDPELLAAADVMTRGKLFSVFCERYGFEVALAAKLEAFNWMPSSFAEGGKSWLAVTSRRGMPEPSTQQLDIVRNVVCQSSDEEYLRMRAIADERRTGAFPSQRIGLAYAFPEEPAWAADELRAGIAAPPSGHTNHSFSLLFGSVDDAALLEAWLAKAHPSGY